ncbi:hypothetical protein [Mesorhizobium sp. BE184]|uniref:hypothetical protein n=1 Tax=Mesorhizobium sp. BE184 TaxID=2817714 RepID=UPI002863E8D8|nr:hypothetical protein [Mesorhizobium sp. BE184]MDR7032679.1 hypothetical protein [Mesorhizobium sp. BE184]
MRSRRWVFMIACLLPLGASASAEGLLGAAPAQPAPAASGGGNVPLKMDGPLALVKPFYEKLGSELDPVQRGNFIDPARTVLDKADALRKSEGECLDPNMALDNAPADKAQIGGSLKMLDAISGDSANVVVAFVVDGSPHRLEWKLKKIGDAWKIADLLSVTGEWALSQYQCE